MTGGPDSASYERLPLAVVVLTHNEEKNLPACLGSVAAWVSQVVVVDSGSTDRTPDIARSFGATVLTHPFTNHTEQWRWALEHLPGNCEWVLGLDADQHVTPELRDELHKLFLSEAATLDGLDGLYVNRRQIFRGAWIRHGGYYPKYLLKLFRADRVFFDPHDLLDHHFYVPGRTAKLKADIVEENRREDNIQFWIEKHNRYAVRVAREEMTRRDVAHWPVSASLFGDPHQRSVWLKQRWYRLPLFLRPFLYFAYRYGLRRGFLDGKQGFIFHLLHAFWFRLLVDIHLDELSQNGTAVSPHPLSPSPATAGRTEFEDLLGGEGEEVS